MRLRVVLLCISVFAIRMARVEAQAKPQPSPDPSALAVDRAADRAAIRAAMDSFAKAFESRDAKSLAAHFTEQGEFQNVEGTTLQGQAALAQAFTKFFAKTPEVTAQVKPESLRFLSSQAAIEEGVVTVQRGPTELATNAYYTAFVVSENGTWRLAQLTEAPASDEPSMVELSWLVGQWKSIVDDGVEIETTYRWDPGKKFIVMQFKRKDANLDVSGTQIIGLDPATGRIHSWTFEATGGIGEADWIRDDEHWLLDASGTLADGRTLVETNILRRIDDDTLTWQSTDRMLDDVELDDSAPIKVQRIKNGN